MSSGSSHFAERLAPLSSPKIDTETGAMLASYALDTASLGGRVAFADLDGRQKPRGQAGSDGISLVAMCTLDHPAAVSNEGTDCQERLAPVLDPCSACRQL